MMVATGPSSSLVASQFRRRRRGCSKGEGYHYHLGVSLIDIDSVVPLPSPPMDAMGESILCAARQIQI